MTQIKGIDVSKYQGKIDWAKVKAAGVKFAIVRAGYANYDGSITKDPYFATNMAGAIAAGVHVGVYVYSYVETAQAAKKAAQAVLEMAKQYKVRYPLCWDFEHSTLYKKFSKAKNVEICKAALDTWEAAGWYAMLYTYKSFASAYLNMSSLAKYDFWLAHYTTKTNYTGPYGMWQYSSSGTVNGISGRVDMNWAYKDYATLIEKNGLNGSKKQTKTLYTLTIKDMSSGDKAALEAKAKELGLKTTSTKKIVEV